VLTSNSASGGNPTILGKIDMDGENALSFNSFSNYYGYYGKKGETIYLRAYVNPVEGQRQSTRCSGGASFDRRDSFGWNIMNTNSPLQDDFNMSYAEQRPPVFTCSDYLEYTFTEDGLYRINFRNTVGGEGYFRGTVAPSPLG